VAEIKKLDLLYDSSSALHTVKISSSVSSSGSNVGGRSLTYREAPFCGLPFLAWDGLTALRHCSLTSLP